MSSHANTRVTLRRAHADEKPVIDAMLQDYLREMMEYVGVHVPPGPQPYPYLDAYWTDEGLAEGRVPFLILANGEIAGFAFRTAHSRLGHPGPTSNVAEFYIQPQHRRQDIGRRAACALFDRFPGRWEVAQIRENTRARRFWEAVVSDYTTGEFSVHEVANGTWDRVIHVFTTPGARP